VTTIDEFVAALPRKRMGAGVLFHDGIGRVMLVDPIYKEPWDVPGGIVEADESPHSAAKREILEELNLDITPGRLLVVDWVPAQPTRPDAVLYLFEGGILSADQSARIELQATELQAWAWVPMERIGERLTPLLTRRVTAAIHASLHGTTMYLEYGNPVP
jgi:ADP-ribose pyrophosphatase YjhB (NUDIX family)